MDMRKIGLAAGVAASALCAGVAQAETGDGVSIDVAVSAAEIDLMSAEYGFFSGNVAETPLVSDNGSDLGARFDISVSGFDWRLFGHGADGYVRASYQDASGESGGSFAKDTDDVAVVPTGLVGFDEAQQLADDGSGTIISHRDLQQREADIAAGLVFEDWRGFTPRAEVGYRRGEIDLTITADRLGVTPMLEEFSTDESTVTSNCADLSFGLQKTMPLSPSWTFVADASAGAGFCRHELERDFSLEVQIGNSYSTQLNDSLDAVSVRGALNAGLVWRLADTLTVGFNTYVRAESDAPYIAYPTYDIGVDVTSIGLIRLETEARASYGAGISLRYALD
jgi:hypothetical protein